MPHNKRFPEIWKILTRHIDFSNKTVLDIGCGYGDLILAIHKQGAIVYGLDNDRSILQSLIEQHQNKDRLLLVENDINLSNVDFLPGRIDILTCFSVLPYLSSPSQTIKFFSQIADISIIECQYKDDGPGLDWLVDDNDMQLWLNNIWSNVEKIGETLVPDRNKHRGIWLCHN